MDSRLRIQSIAYHTWWLTIYSRIPMEERLAKIQQELVWLNEMLSQKLDPALERAPNLPISSYLIVESLLSPLSYQAYRTTATADGERLLRVGEISFTLIDDWAPLMDQFGLERNRRGLSNGKRWLPQ